MSKRSIHKKMRFRQRLKSGELIRRYKRFLADIKLDTGEVITMHCPNTGSMRNCNEPGNRVWFSDSENTKRKYRHTWEVVEVAPGVRAGINTGLANKLVVEAIDAGIVKKLQGYDALKTEKKYGNENSRIDLLLETPQKKCFVEVKNVTLGEGDRGYFPDSVTERGRKHLRELMSVAEQGDRAVLFFCVQHTGVTDVRPADHLDQKYGETLRQAVESGVEVMAWQAHICDTEITLVKELPVVLDPD
jgi:sugar fermentation stimulation protein A